ncbi:hypothetical protein ACJX0J_008132, partial [Zea mays]
MCMLYVYALGKDAYPCCRMRSFSFLYWMESISILDLLSALFTFQNVIVIICCNDFGVIHYLLQLDDLDLKIQGHNYNLCLEKNMWCVAPLAPFLLDFFSLASPVHSPSHPLVGTTFTLEAMHRTHASCMSIYIIWMFDVFSKYKFNVFSM